MFWIYHLKKQSNYQYLMTCIKSMLKLSTT